MYIIYKYRNGNTLILCSLFPYGVYHQTNLEAINSRDGSPSTGTRKIEWVS